MSLSLVTPPTAEPISVEDVRVHSRISTSADDPYLLQAIKAARTHAESYTRRVFVEQGWALRMDGFPAGEFELPQAPLISVDSVSYVDTNGTTQTLAASLYEVDAFSEPGRMRTVLSAAWPSTRAVFNAVTVSFTAGYGRPKDVPKPIRQALLMLVDHLYEHRSQVSELRLQETPHGVINLLYPYRLLSF